jgi:O-glycosyl hydrolase
MGDELAECVVSYLVYGKQHFGVEPDYYSFNEPDYGVYLRETADEHRDLIKLLGERFQAAGLKTKLLLADVASVTTPASYAQPTVDDAAAYSRVGALSVHSWAGDDYTDWITGMRNWSQFASNFGLPFLVTEVGADASAWHFPWLLNEFAYAMDDLRNYLMVLRHGQPRSGLLWELTNDYGTVYSSGGQILPTKRFWMVKHLADFSPPGGSYLDLETECADLLGVGFAKRARNHSTITLHIGNFGPAREATIVGLSSRLEQLAVLRTSESESLQGVGMVRVERGAALLQLGPQSLTTLVGRAREPGRRW